MNEKTTKASLLWAAVILAAAINFAFLAYKAQKKVDHAIALKRRGCHLNFGQGSSIIRGILIDTVGYIDRGAILDVRTTIGTPYSLLVENAHQLDLSDFHAFGEADSISVLTFRNAVINSSELAQLCQLKGVRMLTVEKCPKLDYSTLFQSVAPDQIDSIVISDDDFRGVDALSLGRFPKLQWLTINSCSISDDSLRALLDSEELANRIIWLKLTRMTLSNATLYAFTKYKSLQSLDISDTRLPEGAAEILCQISSLKYVDISKSNVCADGKDRLREQMHVCDKKSR